MGLVSDTPWQGNFLEPTGWYVLQFAVQLGDYGGNPVGLSASVRLQDTVSGAIYATTVSFTHPLEVVSVRVPTPNAYVVQVVRPEGGRWLTITRKEVQATAPAPLTYGAPFAWQGSFPVPYGVLNPANGNLMIGLGLFAWGGQAGVAFGLTYNAQDSRAGVLGVGWRHRYEARLDLSRLPLVVLNEPDGRQLEFVQQPDGSFTPMKGVYAVLRVKGGQYELVRPSQVRWVFDGDGRLVAVRDLHDQGVSLAYNAAGQLVRVEDTTGRTVELSYYAAGDVVPGTNTLVPSSWCGHLKQVQDALGRVWQFTYYPFPTTNGGLEFPEGDNSASVYLREVIWPSLTYANEPAQNGKSFSFRYTAGRLTWVKDREGYQVEYLYDGRGESAGYNYWGKDPNIPGGGGLRAPCAVPVVRPELLGGVGKTVQFGISQRTNGTFAYLTYQYDALGRLMRVIDPLNRTTQLGWNRLYQLSGVQAPSGATTQFCWDERGNLTRVEDPLGRWVEMEYTALNRLKSIRDALTPPNQYRRLYEYNAFGDLSQTMELAGTGSGYANTLYVWDTARGLLQEVWDANGHRTQQYTHDAYGHTTKVADALGKGATVQRNRLGWVEQVTNARGQVMTYHYDSWGRLREKRLPEKWVLYAYDLEGRLLQMQETEAGNPTNGRRRTTWHYQDTTGELQWVETPEGVVEYVWERGQLKELIVKPTGSAPLYWKHWKYEYNLARELEVVWRVEENGVETEEVQYVRDSYGRLQRVVYGNGTVVEYSYTAADEVRAETYKAGNGAYRRVEYERDEFGRVWRKREYQPNGSGGWTLQAMTEYTYDHQGQLIREVRTGVNAYTVEYSYDLVGNRLTRTKVVNGQTRVDGMSYNAANQLTALNGEAWLYDADGNGVVRRVNGATWLFGYDSEGNLVSVRRQGDAVGWEYAYDGLGRRVRGVRGTLEQEYLYSGDVLVAERANGGEWVYNGYGLAMYQRNGEWQYWDVLGNRIAYSDTNGQMASVALYDAFGDRVSGTTDLYDWNGVYHHRAEPLTGGLVLVGRRWYDPTVGRFLQRDPAYASPVYVYCWNDPIQSVDILGWKPGDKYKSPDAAGKAAIRDIWEQSQREGVEYGGWVYRNDDGTYSYTEPVRGTPDEVNFSDVGIPKGATHWGGYHTHVPIPDGALENFSEVDKNWVRYYCSLPLYLGTPGGIIKKLEYDIFTNSYIEKAIGRVR